MDSIGGKLKTYGLWVVQHWHWWAFVAVAVLWWQRANPELVEVGTVAPPIEAQLSEGQSYRGQDGDDEVVLLNFWATWCGACRNEIDDLEAIHRAYRGPSKQGADKTKRPGSKRPRVRVVGLSVEDARLSDLHRQARSLGATYPVGLAPRGAATDYKVEMLPTTYVIGAGGQVKDAFVGGVSQSRLREAIESAY